MKFLTAHERLLLSGIIPLLVNLLGKPSRPNDLMRLCVEDVNQWIRDGYIVLKEGKSSCNHDLTFLPCCERLKSFLRMYVTDIRPFLARGLTRVIKLVMFYICFFFYFLLFPFI